MTEKEWAAHRLDILAAHGDHKRSDIRAILRKHATKLCRLCNAGMRTASLVKCKGGWKLPELSYRK